jgi:hypothetical protein
MYHYLRDMYILYVHICIYTHIFPPLSWPKLQVGAGLLTDAEYSFLWRALCAFMTPYESCQDCTQRHLCKLWNHTRMYIIDFSLSLSSFVSLWAGPNFGARPWLAPEPNPVPELVPALLPSDIRSDTKSSTRSGTRSGITSDTRSGWIWYRAGTRSGASSGNKSGTSSGTTWATRCGAWCASWC